jgi:hypothetical protein
MWLKARSAYVYLLVVVVTTHNFNDYVTMLELVTCKLVICIHVLLETWCCQAQDFHNGYSKLQKIQNIRGIYKLLLY